MQWWIGEHGGWLVPFADDGIGAAMTRWFARADAFLLGRRTYEIFASHWPHAPDDNPIAAALNTLPKYVVSTTLDSPDWRSSAVIGSDMMEGIAALNARPGRELPVHGSGQLAQALIAHGQIDEYRLLVFPVFVGAGRRLFEAPALTGSLQLLESTTTDAGVVLLTYELAGPLARGSFALAPEPPELDRDVSHEGSAVSRACGERPRGPVDWLEVGSFSEVPAQRVIKLESHSLVCR